MLRSQVIKVVAIVGCTLASLVYASIGQAQITEYGWGGTTGAQNWQQNGNWNRSGFPNDPLHLANLSVGLASDLTLSIGATDVTIAGMNIGSSTTAVTTDIVGAGMLRIQNNYVENLANADFNNNSRVEGGDFLIWQRNMGTPVMNAGTNANGNANMDLRIDELDLAIWEMSYGKNRLGLNSGRAIITTSNVAGVTNQISTNVRLVNEALDIRGFSDLTFAASAGISYEQDPMTAAQGVAGASINNTTAGITTTINGPISVANTMGGEFSAFGLNTAGNSRGTLIVNGDISGGGNLILGVDPNSAPRPLHTIRLNGTNTHTGGTRIQRGNLEVGSDNAFGSGRISVAGADGFGWNIIPFGGDRTITNDWILQRDPAFKGDHNVTLAGEITQGNNVTFLNLLSEGNTVTISGTVAIWGNDDVDPVRDFEFDGSGKTVVTGNIQNLSDRVLDEFPTIEVESAGISKRGTGVLVIDVAPGNNEHNGPTIIEMGNFHYANVGSLNVGGGPIISRGGAIGIDTGLSNTTAGNEGMELLDRIDPSSFGGLMLAPSDAAAAINFNTGDFANARNMSLAAPETGLTFTGSITPHSTVNTYALGGGTGTLTLPNAQLTGNNDVEIRNGGTVELLGDNTYTGTTKIVTRYTTSFQEQAAADSANENDATSLFYDRLVAPTLVVDDLANGGSPSSIGSSSSDAANLEIQGSTLKYVGTGDSTNRLFTIGTGGATLDSSGTGAVVFSNAGQIVSKDAQDVTGDVDDFTEGNVPNVIYNVVGDTTDVIDGMPVSDPNPAMGFDFTQAPCQPNGANCIPANTTVTGVSPDGTQIGLSNTYPFVSKLGTLIVFGTVERDFTLTGSNADANTIAGIISDSGKGGVVNLVKQGSGTWVLTGNNNYTGDTTVEEGILSITNSYLADGSTVSIDNGGFLDLDFAGSDVIDTLLFNGVAQSDGLWGAIGNVSADFTSSLITGTGLLNVGGVALSTLAAVPEPSALLLAGMALLGLTGSRQRVVR